MSTASDEKIGELVANFHEAGFGVIRKAVEPAATEKLRAQLDAWFDPRPPEHATPQQRLLPRIVERHERFAGLATSAPLVATLVSIFGVVPHLEQYALIRRSAAIGHGAVAAVRKRGETPAWRKYRNGWRKERHAESPRTATT